MNAGAERTEKWDEEWEQLIRQAKELGLSAEEVRDFLKKSLHSEYCP
ncbi:anti-repressor SinI family protein [Alteribacter natronophilus]|nr:anti-repressor SinI family protein [Alteribacter natronophilus]TMW73816.1 DNA-binding anti-repressor SinI [Alteribacter natronophilus]